MLSSLLRLPPFRCGKIHHVELSFDEWCSIPDHPLQRDTVRHLKKLAPSLQKKYGLTLNQVSASRTQNGAIQKQDGHTRTLGWKTGAFPAPQTVLVTLYDVTSSQAEDLYREFNNAVTSKDVKDDLYGIFNFHNFQPQSDCVKQGGIPTAMRTISRIPDLKDLVEEWLVEIKVFDQLKLSRQQMPVGFVAACLLSIRKHGETAIQFWTCYTARRGEKRDGKRDPVEFLLEKHVEIKKKKQCTGSGNNRKNCDFALGCVERFVRTHQEVMSRKPEPILSLKYLESLEDTY